MTTGEIRKKIKKILDQKDSPDVSHGLTDDLFEEVLTAIAQGQNNGQELALAALAINNHNLERWYS